MLAGIILGDNPTVLETIIADLALGLGTLKYSRNNEYEADEYAVKYLYDTDYHPLGVAGFFQKLKDHLLPLNFSVHTLRPRIGLRPLTRCGKVWEARWGKLSLRGIRSLKIAFHQLTKILC